MDIIAMLQAVPGAGPYLPYILVVFGICAIVAAQLPPPKTSGTVYDVVYRCVNLLGQNYNHATNVTVGTNKSNTAPPAATILAFLVPLGLALALTACSGAASNPAGDVAAIESSLTAAETIATAYVRLPACTGTNGPLCAQPSVVAQIKTADAQAYTLVKAAEQAADDPSAVSAALAAVTALTLVANSLPKQGN
jgi:hypothetical protein